MADVLVESDVLTAFLGRAVEMEQARRTGIATLTFVFFSGIAASASASYVPQYQQMSKDDQRSWCSWVISMGHALTVSLLCISLVVFPDEAIENDRVYGYSDRANLAFSISTGFFLYDLSNCFKSTGPNWAFVFHHVACAICYTFVQFPFLAYYAVRFLLFELSTPFLNMRNMLLATGHHGSPLVKAVEKAFGYTFLIVRIFMGIPLSIMAMKDAFDLVQSGREHSLAVVCYFVLANLGLNGLNLFWLSTLIRKAVNSKSK